MKGWDEVVTVQIRRHENLIGMSIKFDRCWNAWVCVEHCQRFYSLASLARPTEGFLDFGRLGLVLGPLIQQGKLCHVSSWENCCRQQKWSMTAQNTFTRFHKNIISLVIILISKHVLFRMMQKYLRPVINCFFFLLHKLVFLWCHLQFESYPYTFASCSYGCKILQSNHTMGLRYRCIPKWYYPPLVLFWRQQSQKVIVNNKWFTFASTEFCCRIHVNQPFERVLGSDTF